MIREAPVETSAEIIEETVMIALEKQFHDSSACLNMDEYLLHRRSEIALSYCYQAINRRKVQSKLVVRSKV